MTTALIITTYNKPSDLCCCLESVSRQSVMPDEIIIADDGSGKSTADLIEEFRPKFNGRLKHVWQPDEGFRLSRIRNKGINAAESEYIIFIDGDIILHPRYIEDHIKWSRRGFFVGGLRSYINERVSDEIRSGKFKGVIAWYRGFLTRGLCSLRVPILTPLFIRHHSRSVSQFMGSNMSFWRDDALAVGGFDEGFTSWGAEDREFASRLINKGICRRFMMFAGIQFHLHH